MFNAYKEGKIDPCVADNVVIAWPVFFQIIKNNKNLGKKIMDYGCGTGGLCNALYKKGFKLTGIDISRKMIAIARSNTPKAINYYCGDKSALRKLKHKFNIITSLMAFQFIADFPDCLPAFFELLDKRGLLIFAVFNPDFVKKLYKNNTIFSGLKRIAGDLRCKMAMGKKVNLEVYVRTERDYRKIIEKGGFEFVSSTYPPFTRKFVQEYGWQLPSDIPEFLIMAFRKITD